MASGSSSSSMLFTETTRVDHMEPVMNYQQDSNLVLPTSLVPAQLHHDVVPHMEQSNQPEPSYPNAKVVVAVSPTTLLDANRYVCDVCFKGFPRLQNLQFHRRVHNLFKPRVMIRKDLEPRKLYICPETSCNHHLRSHAIGNFGGLRKHYLRKHSNEKKYVCDSCSKKYAVEMDLKAHLKICGARKYNCQCGARFSRSSQFTYHQGVCDAQEHEGATTHLPALDMGDSSVGSTSNNSSSGLIGSTVSHLPMFDMGDNTIRSTSNTNINSLIGSTMSNISSQISPIQNPFNSYPSTVPDQSQSSQFGEGHESRMTDPSIGLNMGEIGPAFFSDISRYANLLANNIPFDNSDLNTITFMGNGGNYGSGEGLNSFSSVVSLLDHSSSHNLTSVVHNTTLRQQILAPQFVLNENLLGLTSRNNTTSNIAQGCTSSSSGGIDGFIMPQDHNVLDNERFGIADDIGYNTTLNELLNPASGNDVGSSIFNQDVGGSYNLGDYYCFGDEVFNFNT